MRDERVMIELKEFTLFRCCPYCGDTDLQFDRGDYHLRMSCSNMDCDETLQVLLFEEFRGRYPNDFERMIRQ